MTAFVIVDGMLQFEGLPPARWITKVGNPKIGLYPGTFNPWHAGHADILAKALKVFDKVIVAQGINPEKRKTGDQSPIICGDQFTREDLMYRITVVEFWGLLVDYISSISYYPFTENHGISAVIRGLRNGDDLQYEMNQQYWNEDLGLNIPTAFFITNRNLAHISSSALRAISEARHTGDLHQGAD